MAELLGHEVHPAAELFPLMAEPALAALAANIEANGLLDPIERFNGAIVDGRNRLLACELANVEPRFVDLSPDIDPVEYVISKNITRRHLTPSQRAISAAEAWEMFEVGQGKRSDLAPKRGEVGGRTDAKLAAIFSVGKNAVQQARALVERDPDAAAAVKAGTVSLTEAYERLRARETGRVSPTPAPALLVEQLPTSAIHANTWNMNRQESKAARAGRESISVYGFVEPPVVRPHPDIEGEYEIVNGEHRWRAATEQGYEEIPCVVLELDDVQAKKEAVFT